VILRVLPFIRVGGLSRPFRATSIERGRSALAKPARARALQLLGRCPAVMLTRRTTAL
jgi:hypothetical protein